MADAIPVTRKSGPQKNAAAEAAQLEQLAQLGVAGVAEHDDLKALAAESRKAGKVVIEYPNMVRVDN